MLFTCYAAIAPAFARVIFYQTFVDMVDAAIAQDYASDALALFDAICGDVWRACKRNNDMRAWELFKTYVNRCLHERGEIAGDKVCAFTWAGELY